MFCISSPIHGTHNQATTQAPPHPNPYLSLQAIPSQQEPAAQARQPGFSPTLGFETSCDDHSSGMGQEFILVSGERALPMSSAPGPVPSGKGAEDSPRAGIHGQSRQEALGVLPAPRPSSTAPGDAAVSRSLLAI